MRSRQPQTPPASNPGSPHSSVSCAPAAACASGGAPSGERRLSHLRATSPGGAGAPTTQVAQQYITAFNKVYPNIHVTFKMLTIAGYNAAIRPALASSVGPDVFDVAPGGRERLGRDLRPGRGQP